MKIPKKLMDKFEIGRFIELDDETLQIIPINDDVELLEQVDKFMNDNKFFVKDENCIILIQNIITCFKTHKYWSDNEKFIIEVMGLKYPLYYNKEFKQWYIQGYTYAKGYEHNKKELAIND